MGCGYTSGYAVRADIRPRSWAWARSHGFGRPDEYLPDESFLRCRQTTNTDWMVEFHTIYPGWHPGRTVHIHLIVHTAEAVLTSQLYFPDDINDAVLGSAPYRDRPARDTTNDTDTILPTGGEPAIVDVVSVDSGCRVSICLSIPTDPDRAST